MKYVRKAGRRGQCRTVHVSLSNIRSVEERAVMLPDIQPQQVFEPRASAEPPRKAFRSRFLAAVLVVDVSSQHGVVGHLHEALTAHLRQREGERMATDGLDRACVLLVTNRRQTCTLHCMNTHETKALNATALRTIDQGQFCAFQ